MCSSWISGTSSTAVEMIAAAVLALRPGRCAMVPPHQTQVRESDHTVLSEGRAARQRQLASDWCYLKILTARAMTRATVTNEIRDLASIVSFAHRESGMTSVGLKAVALVKERYR